jgi:hypothetical protein
MIRLPWFLRWFDAATAWLIDRHERRTMKTNLN